MPAARLTAVAAVAAALCAACSQGPHAPWLTAPTPAEHARFFQIASGHHALDCNSCHGATTTFKQFDCLSCHAHEQAATSAVHASVPGYNYASASCYACHQGSDGGVQAFSHTGLTASCASCHDVAGSFAALPVAGFTHPSMQGADCAACHAITSWQRADGPAGAKADPAQSITVTAQIPTYSGTSIATVAAEPETLPMPMNHASAQLPKGVTCLNCHLGASQAAYYPGVFHASLAALNLPQPAACADCHRTSTPAGFVGALAASPARSPASGEMKHDAVLWTSDAPTQTPLVSADCAACHLAPAAAGSTGWTLAKSGSSPAVFHAALATAGLPQPASCVDCHANTRPAGLVAVAGTSISFDHSSSAALGDCVSCHASDSVAHLASWSGGKFHAVGSAAPSSCLPCHASERPTSTSAPLVWQNQGYATRPFDYGTNTAGITHGDGQDCVSCHANPGTGAWGVNQNWAAGSFAHGPATVAGTTCIACHMSQRPDLQPGATAASALAALGFDHSVNGTGDCFGCHQATVSAARYASYNNPSTGTLPGGDWSGGSTYPGATLVGSANTFVTVTQLKLARSASTGLATGVTTSTATLYNQMLHTSSQVPSAISPGPAASPDYNSCWHCHAHDATGKVTGYAGGQFHASLKSYSATPGGTVSALPEPTACLDCHAQMRPPGIVEKSASELQPMDHAALFTSAATIGGVTASGVAGVDCASCHKQPGVAWTDGTFHQNLAGATPQDCAVCHYPLMSDAPKADLTSGTLYAMKHGSRQLTTQNCQVCHGAIGPGSATLASTQWQGGAFHASVSTQPSSCVDCHAGAEPAGTTQGSTTYAFAHGGGTSTNGAQWMNHAAGDVIGKDCALCHGGDAMKTGSAWNKGDSFHGHVATPTACQVCHGTGNGNGSTPGTNNNLPAGLTDSSMVSSASTNPATGVPAGTHDQITHADVNVSGRDCNACHVQAGVSAAPTVAGAEWAQASFHANATGANALVMNGTTGRCSNCHLNVKPGPSYTAQDHSSFTAAPGSKDCSSCHAFPGTGTAASPNWLGGSGAPQFITVGGFTIPQPPAPSPTTQGGIANLPHPALPAGTSCTACHASASGGTSALGYDHASSLISTNCASCHEAGSNLVGTPWNGATAESAGAGDTRPFTLTSVVASFKGNSRDIPYPNHFYPVDCNQCHLTPAGIVHTTTGPGYLGTQWHFPHNQGTMSNPSTCVMCHTNGIPN